MKAPAPRPPAFQRKVVYRPQDTAPLVYERDLGDPGQYPFTRGIYDQMYRRRLWTMRQYAGYATAEESNRRYRYLLSQGSMGLSVAFDLPTQLGLDSDHPLAYGEVGRVGVAIDTVADVERLFEGIPLAEVSTSMTINAPAAILLAFYLVVARRRGDSWQSLRGTVQNDVLKEYVARGTYIYPPKPSLRLVADVIAYCQRQVPRWNPISVSGYHIREAGATAEQEIGFTLANAETYIESVLESGLPVDDFAPRISFFFAAHNDLFEEAAKFRAARRIWARLMRNRFGAKQPKSWMLRFHSQTAGSTLTAQQPANNVVRVTLQALAAILGGTQSLHTNARDEALALPSEEAARLALRTQQVLAYESGVASVSDPLGGSWFVEKLTGDLEQQAENRLEKIRSLGGTLSALECGYVRNEIERAAYHQQKQLESEQAVVVGVNRFVEPEQVPLEILRISPEIEAEQVQHLEAWRLKHPRESVEPTLDAVRRAARGRGNLMPPIIAAAEAGATVGEIADAMRQVFGEYQASTSRF